MLWHILLKRATAPVRVQASHRAQQLSSKKPATWTGEHEDGSLFTGQAAMPAASLRLSRWIARL